MPAHPDIGERPGDRAGSMLVVLHEARLGGASIATLRLIEPLQAMGWRLRFWTPAPGSAYEWLAERRHDVVGLTKPIASSLIAMREPPGVGRRLVRAPGYLRAFQAHLHAAKPDVVHANSLYSFAEALVARARGVPTVLHLHDMAPLSWKADPVRWMSRWGVDECIAVSRACASSYAFSRWSPAVVHGAAPLPRWSVEIREQPRPFVVGTMGVISRRKGSDVFVEAARIAQERRPGALAFRMIGAATDPLDRSWADQVLARASEIGIEYREHASAESEFQRWDALALPSRRDPFPLVTMEAMAAGLPVIAARTDGIPEQIMEGTGVLVESGDPAALAEAMLALAASSAADREKMGAAARRRIGEELTIERQAKGMDRAYRSAIARRRGMAVNGRGPDRA